MWPKRPASVVIDSATYLLMFSLPDIDNVAISLYDIIIYFYKPAPNMFNLVPLPYKSIMTISNTYMHILTDISKPVR